MSAIKAQGRLGDHACESAATRDAEHCANRCEQGARAVGSAPAVQWQMRAPAESPGNGDEYVRQLSAMLSPRAAARLNFRPSNDTQW
jgi:hypothetical protein